MVVESEYKELNLVIGEAIPDDAPSLFHTIILYQRDENGELKLYSKVELPYMINYSEFLDITGDPRYFFEEGHDEQHYSCKYRCMLKPLGERAGVYRLMGTYPMKIRPINRIEETPIKKLETNKR